MPVPPKFLVNVGAGILTARTKSRLRCKKSGAVPAQEKTFRQLADAFAQTQFWRQHRLEAGIDYKTFHDQVPLHSYEDLAPSIERMKRGEANVLWPGQCTFYAISSGTTAGRTKYLPITGPMIAHFRKAGLDSLLYYAARTSRTKVFHGRHLFLGGSTALTPIEEVQPFAAYAGDLSGITALHLPPWVEKHLYEPGTEIASMSNWPEKIQAIVDRTWQLDITLLAGIPSWILVLAETLRTQISGAENLQALWPHLECLVHGGVPLGPFENELRTALGPTVNFHEVYPASEGFFAAQDADSAAGLRLLADAGLFFEFLPLSKFDETRLTILGLHAVPLEGVKPGVDYVLLLTTPAGLCRYVVGDVVRFVSTEPPRLIYVGRTKLQLSAFGEHVIEKELTDALLAVCQRHGWTIINFHVAPIFANAAAGRKRGQHEWWVELKVPTIETPTGPVMAPELDAELQRLNDDYEAKRKGGGLEPPVVRLVMPGVFEQWMRSAGKWGGQSKMPRCRSDREIADPLAEITRFHTEN
ncbi:MAG TPA: GH3 auxin-responsive promoter family protein [Opitutaceae bacterium]|nr:GH3 auxin-responsive promoter family protein [Opitutaceae bacterium]